VSGGTVEFWWVFLLGLVALVVIAVVVALLTRRPPYAPPPGMAIVATVRRHEDALPLLLRLSQGRIDAQVAEESAKPFWRRLPLLLYSVYPRREPSGPWHVLVSTSDLAEARRVLAEAATQVSVKSDGTPV
jgi:hypothetical protein